jgi:hypothetical protein
MFQLNFQLARIWRDAFWRSRRVVFYTGPKEGKGEGPYEGLSIVSFTFSNTSALEFGDIVKLTQT